MRRRAHDSVMTQRGLVLDDGTLRLEFVRTVAETAGELHEMLARYAPRSPWPPAHHHPSQDERFLVTEGCLRFRLDGEARRVDAGDELVIPAGVVHQARNDADVPAVAVWQTRPAGRTAAFHCAIHEARTRGTLLDVARVIDAYSDVFRLNIRPRPLVRSAVWTLARVARLVDRLRSPVG
jgi:quercetin dioxygenase-like cupin family protein